MSELDDAKKALRELMRKPKPRSNKPATGDYRKVVDLIDEISAAMAAGYTVMEIRETLTKSIGLKASLATFRRYVSQVRHDMRIKGE